MTQPKSMSFTTFKRLNVGDRFTCASGPHKDTTFRKASTRGAFKIKTGEFAGRGETHAQVPFARSSAVAVTVRVGSAARDGVTLEV